MANYQNLKSAISAAIRTNGNQEITGQVLQYVLNSIVSVIGANYTFAGVATPSTNPGTPDQNVMYLAMEGGTYTNFNGTVLPAGISLLMWNGTWRSETVMYGDGGVFDISVYKSSGGTLATFADLTAALGTNGANIPEPMRKGGMSVKFVCSSDNKYVQYRLMKDQWSTTESDWAIDDKWFYEENPDWLYVITTKEKYVIGGIKANGEVDWVLGVPTPIRKYVEEHKEDMMLYLRETLDAELTTVKSDIVSVQKEAVYDVSAHNDGAVFESLQALLNSSSLSTLIPTSVRCGGMSIRFIQGSVPNYDNKYVQFRLMKDQWSTTESDWAIDDKWFYEENPDWLYAITTKEKYVIGGIKANGEVDWVLGVPTPIRKYVEEHKEDMMLYLRETYGYYQDSEDYVKLDIVGNLKLIYGGITKEGIYKHFIKHVFPEISSPEVDDFVENYSSIKYDKTEAINGFINSQGFVNTYKTKLFPVKAGDIILVKSKDYDGNIAFLKDNELVVGSQPHFSSDPSYSSLIHVPVGSSCLVCVPSDAMYLYWQAYGYNVTKGTTTDFVPEMMIINGQNYMQGVADDIKILNDNYIQQKNVINVTPYWNDENSFREKVFLLSNKDTLQFLLHTDNHSGDANRQRADDHASVYAKVTDRLGLDFQVNLGDVFDNTDTADEDLERLRDFISICQNSHAPFMYVKGNHETFYERLTENQIFGACCRKYNRYINVVRSEGDSSSCLYYYFDMDFCKIRCFCLDSGTAGNGGNGYSSAEVTWLQTNIDNLPAGYGVVIMCHIPFYAPAKWKDHVATPYENEIRNYLINKVSDGLNLIAVIHGHMHWDNVVYDEDLKCPFIATASDKWEGYRESYPSDVKQDGSDPYYPQRKADSIKEYLADEYNLSNDREEIDVIRFGAGRDRYIHRDFITVTETLALPQTKVENPQWSTSNASIVSIVENQIVRQTTGNVILYAKNESSAEFWYIV